MEKIIVFSDWSGWNSGPLTEAEYWDHPVVANTRAARMPEEFVEVFLLSLRDHVATGSAIDWSHAKEV